MYTFIVVPPDLSSISNVSSMVHPCVRLCKVGIHDKIKKSNVKRRELA